MCEYCWMKVGSPQIWNEKVETGIKLMKGVYEFDEIGGNLHPQLDDYNLQDCFFEEYEPFFDEKVSAAQDMAERTCFIHFQNMTEDERYSAVAHYDGIWRKE